MTHENIESIARLVQKAFFDIRRNILNNNLSEEQEAAIASLPSDNITGAAHNRLKKFPNDCCVDASNVMAIIFIAFADQNGFQYSQLKQIRCRPTDKTKTRMFDFHQWLLVDDLNVDITFGQCKAVLKDNEDKVVFDTHPLVGSDDYIFEGGNAIMEEPFAEFANFIIKDYFKKSEG